MDELERMVKLFGFRPTDRDEAMNMQQKVIDRENQQLSDGIANYQKDQVNQAIVHTRQDLVLVVSQVSGLNMKMNSIIKRLNVLISLLAVLILASFVQQI